MFDHKKIDLGKLVRLKTFQYLHMQTSFQILPWLPTNFATIYTIPCLVLIISFYHQKRFAGGKNDYI